MQRLLAVLGSIVFSLLLTIGLFIPLQETYAADACRFSCQVTLGASSQNCNPSRGPATDCPTQCTSLCNALDMAPDTTQASTCRPATGGLTSRGDVCSPCSCIPNAAIACINVVSGRDSFCAAQCGTTCSARAADVTRLQGSGSAIGCAERPDPQCVAVNQAGAVRLCQACIRTCVNDTTGDVQRTPQTCYTRCTEPARQNACRGVSTTEANLQEIGASRGQAGTTGSTGGGTAGATGAPPASQGTCRFNCQPQIPRPTCTTDQDCAATCQQVCGRSFRDGQCPTTGPGAARCVEAGSGMPKQCAFECSIGTSQQERSCNTVGTGPQAPGTVCGAFCEESCRTAATSRPAGTARFCGGSAPTCIGTGGTAGGATSAPSTSGQTSGAGAGVRLPNPISGVDSIAGLVGRLVKGVLGVVGSVALLMFVYGGIRWILSAGEPKEVTNAKNILRNATIGLVLIFFSYSISSLIIGFLEEVGTGTSQSSSSSGSTGGTGLATCVQYAVTHGHIGQNEAQDRTTASWACRQTQPAERDNRSICIRNGCPNDPATVLCCAPVGGTDAGATGGTNGTTPVGTAPSATPGCRTTIVSRFRLRATETADPPTTETPGGTQVEVLAAGTAIRSGTRIHRVRVVSGGATGWTYLTGSEVSACRAP